MKQFNEIIEDIKAQRLDYRRVSERGDVLEFPAEFGCSTAEEMNIMRSEIEHDINLLKCDLEKALWAEYSWVRGEEEKDELYERYKEAIAL